MQNISTLISQARAYGHEDTFSSTRRPRTREEFASPFSVFKQTLTLMGVIGRLCIACLSVSNPKFPRQVLQCTVLCELQLRVSPCRKPALARRKDRKASVRGCAVCTPPIAVTPRLTHFRVPIHL